MRGVQGRLGIVSVLVVRVAAQHIPQTIQTFYGTIDKLGCEQSHRQHGHGRTQRFENIQV